MMTTMKEQEELLAFAKKAARAFASNPKIVSYTNSGHLNPGELIAMRWGMGNDCVLVSKLDADFEPMNFQQLVKEI